MLGCNRNNLPREKKNLKIKHLPSAIYEMCLPVSNGHFASQSTLLCGISKCYLTTKAKTTKA